MPNWLMLFIGFIWFCSSTLMFAQGEYPGGEMGASHYEKEWKQVDSLVREGLPKSALEAVDKIYRQARAARNYPQLVKAVFRRLHLKAQIEEQELIKQIRGLEAEIESAPFPARAILQSALAETYWAYYQQNRWKILDRTPLSRSDDPDPRSWDARQFVKKTLALYQASLSQAADLQKIPLADWEVILVAEPESRLYRPTLFDLLAHRAVDFLGNQESGLTLPVTAFQMDDPAVFAAAEEFVQHRFNSPDQLSLKYKALRIYQALTAFHLRDDDPTALIDLDLGRLKFAHEHSVYPEKEQAYREALERLQKQYRKHPASTLADYALASFYEERSRKYLPGVDERYRWDRAKALKICREAIKMFPEGPGAKNCRSLISQILAKQLSLAIEKVNLPQQPFPGLISFQNVSRVYFKIVAISPEDLQEIGEEQRFDTDRWINYFRAKAPVKEWSLNLPDPGDYHRHSAEIRFPELSRGYYAILMGSDPTFQRSTQAATFAKTWISRIGFVEREEGNPAQPVFYLADREEGTPLRDVRAKLWVQKYDNRKRRNIEIPGESFRSDKSGKMVIDAFPHKERYYRFRLDFHYKDDRLFLDDYFDFRPRGVAREARPVVRTFFFTDRSIYRPGQTVYFKGLVVKKQEKRSEVVSDYQTTVTFYDVNRQKISELKLASNRYGSFSGSFIIPVSGLTGLMSIRNENGEAAFSVEEYKRPTFEVNFDPAAGSFRLNDAVEVSGKAASYAGANLSRAIVHYRVVRQARFPYIWRSWRAPDFSSEQMEIANGFTETDEQGQFRIQFKALPDLSIPEKDLPVFDYQVSVDVADISGETHSAQTNVQVGYVALAVNLALPERINREAPPQIALTTENLNGEFEAARGTVTFYPLKTPERLFRERLWQTPDTFLLSREEFYRDFPHDAYRDENDYHNWTPLAAVYEYHFDTGEVQKFSLPGIDNWEQGKYKVVVSCQDKFGKPINLVRFFELYSLKEPGIPARAMVWNAAPKTTVEPGEIAQLFWGSAAPNVRALLEVYHQDRRIHSQWVKTGGKKKTLAIPVREEYRGSLAITIFFVKYGRVYQVNRRIEVPREDKRLQISYETFRDKLTPGREETWKLKIRGPGGEKVAAEMLASMFDASLEAFRPHRWQADLLPFYPGTATPSLEYDYAFGYKLRSATGKNWNRYQPGKAQHYDRLEWSPRFYPRFDVNTLRRKGAGIETMASKSAEGVQALAYNMAAPPEADRGQGNTAAQEPPAEPPQTPIDFSRVKVRSNLNETAFFYPHLETNPEGEIILSFTMPEALTRWKLMTFAHTPDLKYAFADTSVVTQKSLMVTPHAPRFLRENDRITFTAKIDNLTDSLLAGRASLQLFDALTMQPVDELFKHTPAGQPFRIEGGSNTVVSWDLSVPEGLSAVVYRVVAQAGNVSDGEENALPVLTNRTLVTETLPLPIRKAGEKQFRLESLINSGKSKTLRHYRLTLEFTGNPAWYAVQALPYLMEFPYECSEQVFNRYYANSLAAHIANANPAIRRVFRNWKEKDVLISNLAKNPDLKSLLLEETPWVLQAKDEAERKKRIGLLFDLNKMAGEQALALRKLQKQQLPDGGWPWFAGGDADRYITTYIVSGIGRLRRLGITPKRGALPLQDALHRAVNYLDRQMEEDYQRLLEHKADLEKPHLSRVIIQYLYARSFFRELPLQPAHQVAFDFWQKQAREYWLSYNRYLQGMIALALHRLGDEATPAKIIRSLREHALYSDEFGMYWKEAGGYFWYQAPIETQALMIELFEDVAGDRETVEALKVWLLKQKQTQDWKTTRATAEACYALLLRGGDWLSQEPEVQITLGDQTIDSRELEQDQKEAGSGYFRVSWDKDEIQPQMGRVTVKRKQDGVAWGALYWQYFEQLDKIRAHQSPMKLRKRLFVERDSDRGPVLEEVASDVHLKPGDLLKVRIELEVDRHLEYVHMKDMRSSGLEPVDVLSQYRYQGGLGYYQSTRDAATHFFFAWLPKGNYVFEYPLRAAHKGDFSNGITTIQCMYAPEFAAHSEGVRLTIGK